MPHVLPVLAGGGAAAAFDPSQLTNLKAWYDFSDITTLWKDTARTSAVTADADAIAGVTDKSGAANHLAQATVGFRPLYKTGAQNSRAASRYAVASTQYMATAAFGAALTQPSVVFIACKPRLSNLTTVPFDGIAAGNRHVLITETTGANDTLMNAGSSITGSVAALGTWYLYACVFNGASSKLYRGGGAANASGDAGAQTLTGLTIGASFTPNSWLDGDIGEMFLTNSLPSNATIDQGGNYLASRWGLTWSAVS